MGKIKPRRCASGIDWLFRVVPWVNHIHWGLRSKLLDATEPLMLRQSATNGTSRQENFCKWCKWDWQWCHEERLRQSARARMVKAGFSNPDLNLKSQKWTWHLGKLHEWTWQSPEEQCSYKMSWKGAVKCPSLLLRHPARAWLPIKAAEGELNPSNSLWHSGHEMRQVELLQVRG